MGADARGPGTRNINGVSAVCICICVCVCGVCASACNQCMRAPPSPAAASPQLLTGRPEGVPRTAPHPARPLAVPALQNALPNGLRGLACRRGVAPRAFICGAAPRSRTRRGTRGRASARLRVDVGAARGGGDGGATCACARVRAPNAGEDDQRVDEARSEGRSVVKLAERARSREHCWPWGTGEMPGESATGAQGALRVRTQGVAGGSSEGAGARGRMSEDGRGAGGGRHRSGGSLIREMLRFRRPRGVDR